MSLMKFEDNSINSEDIFIFEINVEQSVDLHSHDFIEIAYVKSGRAWHSLEETKMLLKKGDFFFIDYGVEHGFEVYNNEPVTIVNILFKPLFIDKTLFKCKSFKEILENHLLTLDYCSVPNTFFDETQEIMATIIRMLNEQKNRGLGHYQILRAYLIEIIILALRKYEVLCNKPKNNYVDFAINKLENEYYVNLKLNDIAFELNISPSHLSRLFKVQTSLSFSSYLQKFRLKTAYRLLANTSYKVIEIARMVGYNDYKFFLKIFKTEFQLTPKDIRKMQCINSNKYI